MSSKNVPVKKLCEILAGEGHEPLTEKTISVFVSEGMPKCARGTYDAMACLRWYVGRLRTSVRRKETETPDGTMMSLDKEQTRLIKAKADNEVMTVCERRRELIPLHVYESNMSRIVQTVKMKLLDFPSRLAPKLEGLTRAEAKALMLAMVKGVCADLAQNRYVDQSSPTGVVAAPAGHAKRARARTARKPRASKH
jgi:phage terminase Nu1 subunit (DNA packaging protein)